MTARRLIIYYECIDQPMDASYETSLDTLIADNSTIELLTIDSFSDAYQFDLVAKSIDAAESCLLLIDSQKGEGTKALVNLLNQTRSKGGSLYWCGNHNFSMKAIAMLQGKKVAPDDLQKHVLSWISGD